MGSTFPAFLSAHCALRPFGWSDVDSEQPVHETGRHRGQPREGGYLSRYLDSPIGNQKDIPGASRERRLAAYISEAPRMVEFLIDQGLKFTRVSYWPDYYDEMPGGVEAGRNVVPRLFNVNELGSWKKKLRIGRFAGLPAETEEALELPYYKRSWLSKRLMDVYCRRPWAWSFVPTLRSLS
jgi:3-oxosteroid 1-dehydrogenase